MPHGDNKTPKTRGDTDAALRDEREKADAELARRRSDADASADSVVRTARDRADAVLDAARRREDTNAGAVTDRIRAERLREDVSIAKERKDADVSLEGERVQRQISLVRLLASERMETDSRLLLERQRADEALMHRDDFLAMLSHDMRSLLGAIAVNAMVLERQGQSDPSRLASIQRATAQMTRLMADLLDVASIDAGKLVLVRERHDAASIARHAAEAFEPIASEKNIELSVDVTSEDLPTDLDPDRIGQVLANLLGNAAKFTPPGGKITIGVTPRRGEACFFVSDTGEGIPAEKLETIFDRYSQIARADRRGVGLGLGLFISRRIVEVHGGRLWAESIVGQGSTFFFTLPAQRKEGSPRG